MPHQFASLALNNRWANRTLRRSCAQLTADERSAATTGFFGSIAATLEHILEVDLYYLDALEQRPGATVRSTGTPAPQDPAALSMAQDQADDRLIAFCRALTTEHLAARVETDRGRNGIIPERIDALLLHLFQHQIHHRDQLHAMLSGTSVRPPQLDEFFIEFDRASDAEGPELP